MEHTATSTILPRSGISPYFGDGQFTLFNADSLALLQDFPENSVDMIFADPPYNLSNGGFSVHSGQRASVNKGTWDAPNGFENDTNFHLAWLSACRRILKPNGTIWVSGTYHSIYQCGYALQKLEFHILNDISWFKPNGAPNLSCRFFTASHETLIWAKKDRNSKHTFNYSDMKYGDFSEDRFKNPDKQMRSVWSISTPGAKEKAEGYHPTQKPLQLLERVIQASTNSGDIVLDPFTGSSTTGIAALAHGRKFIGIDSDPKYLELSVARRKALSRLLLEDEYIEAA